MENTRIPPQTLQAAITHLSCAVMRPTCQLDVWQELRSAGFENTAIASFLPALSERFGLTR